MGLLVTSAGNKRNSPASGHQFGSCYCRMLSFWTESSTSKSLFRERFLAVGAEDSRFHTECLRWHLQKSKTPPEVCTTKGRNPTELMLSLKYLGREDSSQGHNFRRPRAHRGLSNHACMHTPRSSSITAKRQPPGSARKGHQNI